MSIWNPWHGCIKYSEGCANCYVYRRDETIGKDASSVVKNSAFDLPLRKNRAGGYKIPSGSTLYTCMTSDFFIEEADMWRDDIWAVIKQRPDVEFIIITKRIIRFSECIPDDWGEGYENVSVCCTVENQKQCDIRLPLFVQLPIRKKMICCEPLLGKIDMKDYLDGRISLLIAGGESGSDARICDYEWILSLREQCAAKKVSFFFKQTGAKFRKDSKVFGIPRRLQELQAQKAGINIDF